MILRYLILTIVQTILMIYSALTGWLTIAPFVTADGHLPYPLRYLFEPTDSPAIGDGAYLSNEGAWAMKYPQGLRNYILCYLWSCLRNPAYGFADLAGFTLNNAHSFKTNRPAGLSDIDVGDGGTTIGSVYRTLINGDGKKYFEYRKIFRWNSTLVCYIQLGWSIPTMMLENGDRRHLCVYVRPFVKG